MTQNDEFDFDRPYTQPPMSDDDLDLLPDDTPDDAIGQDAQTEATPSPTASITDLIASESFDALYVPTDDLSRIRRATEIELAHVAEDLDGRLVWLVLENHEGVWPGKNEEARAISKAAARAGDEICRKLDTRRRLLESKLSACRGELEARENSDAQIRMKQKELELEISKQDLALRDRFAQLDFQLRAAELVSGSRELSEFEREREAQRRTSFVAQYLKAQ